MDKQLSRFTSLISTISPVLMSGTGRSFSDASTALLFNIYEGSGKHLDFLPYFLIHEKNKQQRSNEKVPSLSSMDSATNDPLI